MDFGNLMSSCMGQCSFRKSPFHRTVRFGVVILVFLVVTLFITREYNILHYTGVEYFGHAWVGTAHNHTLSDDHDTLEGEVGARNGSLANETAVIRPEGSYVALCATAKDQNIDICEWLQYHEQVVGIGMFYIMDHGSADPLINTIKGCFDVRRIGYHYFNQTATATFKPQIWAYGECLRMYRHRHRWMAFIDLDEFFVLRQKNVNSISELLQQYEGYGGLVVNWLIFGSSGHIQRPEGGVMANYHQTLAMDHGQNRHIKSIVNTEWVVEPYKDPHHFRYISGHFPVNSDYKRSAGPLTAYSKHNKISLHHYVLKSLEDYKRKASRGSAMGNFKKIQYFNIVDRGANVTNNSGQEAIKKVDPHKYDDQIAIQLAGYQPLTPDQILQAQDR